MTSGLLVARRAGITPVYTVDPILAAAPSGWWKADSEAYADNDPVGTATDRSGNARNLTAATTARPTFKTGIVNSLPVYRFDGTTDVLAGIQLSNFLTNSAYTAYVVVSITAIGTNNADYRVDNNIFGDSGDFVGIGLRTTGPTAGFWNWDGTVDSAALTVATATWMILEGRHESGSILFNKNGAGEVSAASGNTTALTSMLQLGKGGGAATFFGGDVAEFITYPTALASGTRTAIRTALGAKYNISTV